MTRINFLPQYDETDSRLFIKRELKYIKNFIVKAINELQDAAFDEVHQTVLDCMYTLEDEGFISPLSEHGGLINKGWRLEAIDTKELNLIYEPLRVYYD